MLFEKLSFQEQNYGMEGIQLSILGKLNSLDKILLVVLFLLIIVIFYLIGKLDELTEMHNCFPTTDNFVNN